MILRIRVTAVFPTAPKKLMTAALRFDATRLQHDPQPTTYQFAARSLRILRPALAFQILLKIKKPAVEIIPAVRSQAAEIEMLETFRQVLRSIEADVFYKNRRRACGDCQFKRKCDAKTKLVRERGSQHFHALCVGSRMCKYARQAGWACPNRFRLDGRNGCAFVWSR